MSIKHNIHTLPNGLRILLIPMPESSTATVIVMTGTGSRYETESENGLAHFLEHMFFKGTKKRPTARAISEELDAIGSSYNAFTAKDCTAYYAKVSSKYIDTALDVITDIFLNSTLPGKEIAKERGAIIQEIDMYEDMPMRTIDNVFDALIFGENHPLGRTILGPKANIRKFTRKEFSTYLAKHYVPANTVVCVAGSFSTPKVLAKIKRDFAPLKKTAVSTYLPFVSAQNEPRIAIKEKKTDQTQLMLGMLGYPIGHKDEFVLDLLAEILGGGMSSRLFLEVRERRGLAYSVHAWTQHYPDTGYLAVQAGVEHGKLEKTVATVLSELRKIKRIDVSAAELKKAKAHAIGGLALALETSGAIAQYSAGSLLSVGKVQTREEVAQKIEKVTASDIKRVANDLLSTNKLNLAIIGPHEANEKKLLSLLKV